MLYAFGSNGSGQLAISGKHDAHSPTKCLFDSQDEITEPPFQIAAGGNHTLTLFESGAIYSAGSNLNGRAGHSSPESTEKFQKINLGPSNPRVKLCAGLWEASVVVTTTNDVYTFGNGPRGELGTGFTTSLQPQKLLDFPPTGTIIIDVASCVDHTVVILSNGHVYGWGNGRKGQLGEPAEIIWAPRKIENLNFKVVRAVCGKEFTYLVGDHYQGHHAILGTDKWGVRSNAPVKNLDWKDIGASWGSIFVLKSGGKIESWGRNDHGQLAPKNLPDVRFMAVGSEHALAVTKSSVVGWGWGEHGNCGPNTDQRGDVKDGWHEITIELLNEPPEARFIAAGCATSFVWI